MPSQPIKLQCPKCKTQIDAELDQPKIINEEKISMVLLCHSGEVMCVCGEVVVPIVIQAQQFSIGAMLVPKEKRSSLVTPATTIPKNNKLV